ncbi:MAG: hypothetical protein ACXVCH_18450 [Bdellovibrionota bacterium]
MNLSAHEQEAVALFLVGIAVASLFRNAFKTYIAGPLSKYFLKRGKVGMAMKLRSHEKRPGCDDCD